MPARIARTHELAVGAVLTALALAIPLYLRGTFLQLVVGPFTATLASHVPSMLAVFVSPFVAALVGVGSTLGFLATLGPVVAGRAFTHVLFGVAGALLIRRGWSGAWALLAVLPIHAVGEGIVVWAAFLLDLPGAGRVAPVMAGLGSAVHHLLDMAITLVLLRLLLRAGLGRTFGLGFAPARRAA